MDSSGRTLLHVASHRGHLRLIKLLLMQSCGGADADMFNMANKKAAELASESGQVEVTEFI